MSPSGAADAPSGGARLDRPVCLHGGRRPPRPGRRADPARPRIRRPALGRVGERRPFVLRCPDGFVELRLPDGEPIRVTLAGVASDAPWLGTALAGLVEARAAGRAGVDAAEVRAASPAVGERAAPVPVVAPLVEAPRGPAPIPSVVAKTAASGAAATTALWWLRAVDGAQRLQWNEPGVDLSRRSGRLEHGPAVAVAWTGGAPGLLRSQRLGWSAGGPFAWFSSRRIGLEATPRLLAGVARVDAKASNRVVSKGVIAGPVAELDLDLSLNARLAARWRVAAGLRGPVPLRRSTVRPGSPGRGPFSAPGLPLGANDDTPVPGSPIPCPDVAAWLPRRRGADDAGVRLGAALLRGLP